jgi:hypothetical protein
MSLLATLTQRHGGTYIAIWSEKAGVWVQLTNRYHSMEVAKMACSNYGFTLWTKGVTPPKKEQSHG